MLIIFQLFARGYFAVLGAGEINSGAASQKMLIQQLRELEREGVRQPQGLSAGAAQGRIWTDRVGKEMCPALDALLEWAALRPKHSLGPSEKGHSRK